MCILARQFVVIYCFSPSRQKAVLIYRTVDVCVVFAVDCYPVASAMYAPRRRRIVGYTCVSYQCITRPWLFVCRSQTQSTIFRVHRYGRCLYDRWIVVYIFKISAAIWPRPFTRQCKTGRSCQYGIRLLWQRWSWRRVSWSLLRSSFVRPAYCYVFIFSISRRRFHIRLLRRHNFWTWHYMS